MQSPNVCHLVLSLPIGGTERLVEGIIRSGEGSGKIHGLCLDELGTLGENLDRSGFPVSALGRTPGIDWQLPRKIAIYCRQHKIDVLHCHQYTPWFYGIQAKALCRGLKVVFTEHGRMHPDLPSPKRRAYNRVAQLYTDAITAVSPAVQEALVKVEAFAPDRIRVLYNGVSEKDLQVAEDREVLRQSLGLQQDWVYGITVARFDPIKWLPGLIAAFSQVAPQDAKFGLILVGDGSEKEKMSRLVRDGGLEERILMPGFRPDVPRWLKAADLFLLSSLSEGTSVSLVESMGMGLPAVVTDVGGNPYVVEEGVTGILVPSQNEQRLSGGMLRLFQDAELRHRMGRAARERFEKQFTFGSMMDNYQALYRRLLA